MDDPNALFRPDRLPMAHVPQVPIIHVAHVTPRDFTVVRCGRHDRDPSNNESRLHQNPETIEKMPCMSRCVSVITQETNIYAYPVTRKVKDGVPLCSTVFF